VKWGLLTLALCVTLLVCGGAQGEPITYLVSIGNNAGDPTEVQLLYAERDARQVAEVFQDVGQVSGDRLLILTGQTASSIRSALLELNARIRAASHQQSRLIVFYSGHADAQALHLKGTALPVSELRSIVKGSAARIRLLIVDACRSGAVTRVKGVSPAPEFKLTYGTGDDAEGTAILTSSAAGENSQESDRLRGSFFSHHLITGLRGAADRSQDGQVTLDEAYAYTYRQTLKSSGRSLELQHPTFEYGIKGKGAIVLTNPLNAEESTGRLRIDVAGLYLVAEGSEAGPVSMEVAIGEKGAIVALPHRRYFVQRRGKKSYREYEISVRPGRTTILTDHPYRTVAYDRLVRKGGGQNTLTHGVSVMSGLHGQTVDGSGEVPTASLGYGLDLRWASLGLRARYSWWKTKANDDVIETNHQEIGLALIIQRYIDLEALSLSLGLIIEGSRIQQGFETTGMAPDRSAYSAGFGGLAALERSLFANLSIRIEGGPMTFVYSGAVTEEGEVVDSALKTPFTWSVQAGFVLRL
jgi:hypothetical protein